jgi:hypothetical protein
MKTPPNSICFFAAAGRHYKRPDLDSEVLAFREGRVRVDLALTRLFTLSDRSE